VRNKSFTVAEKRIGSSESLVLARFYFNINKLESIFFAQVFNGFSLFSLRRKLIFNSLLNVILTRTQNIVFLSGISK